MSDVSSLFSLTSNIHHLTSAFSPFNTKRRVCAGRIQVYFFDVGDKGVRGAGRKIMLEGFDACCVSFSQSFDVSVLQVTHIAVDLMARGGALREETIADALHFPADCKLTRNLHRSRYSRARFARESLFNLPVSRPLRLRCDCRNDVRSIHRR